VSGKFKWAAANKTLAAVKQGSSPSAKPFEISDWQFLLDLAKAAEAKAPAPPIPKLLNLTARSAIEQHQGGLTGWFRDHPLRVRAFRKANQEIEAATGIPQKRRISPHERFLRKCFEARQTGKKRPPLPAPLAKQIEAHPGRLAGWIKAHPDSAAIEQAVLRKLSHAKHTIETTRLKPSGTGPRILRLCCVVSSDGIRCTGVSVPESHYCQQHNTH
jgi:hypothetical protein